MTRAATEVWAARVVAVVSALALAIVTVQQVRTTFEAEPTVSDTTVGNYLFQERKGPALGGQREVRQTITPQLDGLIRLDIRFSDRGTPGHVVRVRLLQEDGDIAAESTAPSEQLLAGNMHVFGFNRISRSAGRRFEVVIDAPDTPVGEGPSVTWVDGDILPGGTLKELAGSTFPQPADAFMNLRALPSDPSGRDELLKTRIDAFHPWWAGWNALQVGVAMVGVSLALAWLALIGTAQWMASPRERILLAITATASAALVAAFLTS